MCGLAFEAYSTTTVYCSKECRDAAAQERRRWDKTIGQLRKEQYDQLCRYARLHDIRRIAAKYKPGTDKWR